MVHKKSLNQFKGLDCMITCFSLSLNSTRCPLPDKHCMASRNLFRQQKNKPNINAKNQSHTFNKRSGIDCIYGNCLRFPNRRASFIKAHSFTYLCIFKRYAVLIYISKIYLPIQTQESDGDTFSETCR